MSNSAKYEEYLKAAKAKKEGNSTAWDNLMTSYKKQAAENMAKGPSLTREEIAAPSYTQPTAPSFYEFMAQNAVNQRNVTYAEAERARKEAEALAEIERKRSIVDASTMAEQQKATYGANAEQMGRMGLTSSGYSDYINSQAYAAGMAGRQAANAHATDLNRQALYTEHMTRLGADKEYNNALAQIETAKYNEQKALEERNYTEQKQKEAQQQTNYQNFMNFAIENGLTAEQISNLAPSYGISTEAATKVAETSKALYGDNATTEEVPTAQDSGYTTLSAIEQDAASLKIDDTTRDKYKADIENESKAMVQYQLDNGDLGAANAKADELYKADRMSKETYQSTKAELAQKNIEGIETEDDALAIKNDLSQMLKKEQISKTMYDKLMSEATNKAKAAMGYGNVEMSGIEVSDKTSTSSRHKQKNITIDNKTYPVSLTIAPNKVVSILEDVKPKAGTITEYKGKYYIYDGGWFAILPHTDTLNPINNFYEAIKTKTKK
jgi:hypothetical protein